MHEIKLFVFYLCFLATTVLGSVGAMYCGAVEAAQYVPLRPANMRETTGSAASPERPIPSVTRDRPVWIAATAKYDYDPKLMEVKSLAERKKDADARRRREVAAHEKQKKEALLRKRRPAEARAAFAAAPADQKPDFLLFPFVR